MNEKLAYTVAKEYLRGLKLTGHLEKIGFDLTDYRPNLCDPMLELLGIHETTDVILDIIDGYEEKVIKMNFFDFIEGGLDNLAKDMIMEIKEISGIIQT
mgnify:CR=1 FL=1